MINNDHDHDYDHDHDLDHVNDNKYKLTESHNLHSLQVNIIFKYTGVNCDPTPISAHTIFRPTKG